MQRLLSNSLGTVEYDGARKLVIFRRSSLPIEQALTDESHQQALAVLRPLRGQRMLADLRLAPGNNSAASEAKGQHLRRDLRDLFPTSATLVATAVGRLQVQRMARERGEPMVVFFSEEEAIAYLMTQPVP